MLEIEKKKRDTWFFFIKVWPEKTHKHNIIINGLYHWERVVVKGVFFFTTTLQKSSLK